MCRFTNPFTNNAPGGLRQLYISHPPPYTRFRSHHQPACLTNPALVFIYVHRHAISCSITFTCQTVHHSDHTVLALAHIFTPTVAAREQRPWRQVSHCVVKPAQCCDSQALHEDESHANVFLGGFRNIARQKKIIIH